MHDPSAYQEAGSRWAWIKEVKSDGTDLGTPDTWHLLPGTLKNTVDYKEPLKTVFAADKKPWATVHENLESAFEFELGQDDIETQIFLTGGAKGKYYAVLNDAGISHTDSNSGKNMRKLEFAPICKVSQEYKSTAPDGRTPTMRLIMMPAPAIIELLSAACPDDIEDKCELDPTAFGLLEFSVGINKVYDPQTCKMTY